MKKIMMWQMSALFLTAILGCSESQDDVGGSDPDQPNATGSDEGDTTSEDPGEDTGFQCEDEPATRVVNSMARLQKVW